MTAVFQSLGLSLLLTTMACGGGKTTSPEADAQPGATEGGAIDGSGSSSTVDGSVSSASDGAVVDDQTLCTNAGFDCGAATVTDSQGMSHSIASCGTCAGGTCTQNVCYVPQTGTVTLTWSMPAANASVSGTTSFVLTGSSLVNVELWQDGAFFQRCLVGQNGTSAACAVDTTKLVNGSQTFDGLAWNSPPGSSSFTSSADAGTLTVTVANAGVTPVSSSGGAQTVGGGTKSSPAMGPGPAYPVAGTGFVLVKNWDFGANGTITNYADMDQHFMYHDQFNTTDNGGNYGAQAIASSTATALGGQPVEDPNNPVRTFTADSMKTTFRELDSSGTVSPGQHNLGCGSFQAQFTLPNGGSRLGQDILWETRVRYVTPQYFWFAIWIAGNSWHDGGEMDLIESFGYDNGGGNTNYNGQFWHSNSVNGEDQENYSDWGTEMANVGFPAYDATQWHTWTLVYKADDSYQFYCDGKLVQNGPHYAWTDGATDSGTPINMSFIFDANWGHNQVSSVDHSLPISAFDGKYYEWDYSRIYLR